MDARVNSHPIEILLVEDNPGDIRLTMEAIKQSKLLNRVHIVSDGDEALQFLRRRGRFHDAVRPDMILLDLQLPGRSGHEVLEEIKSDRELRRIPVAVLTTSDDHQDRARAYAARANCYLTKPIDMEQFIRLVESFEEFWFTVVRMPRRERRTAAGHVKVLLVEDNPGDARLVQEWMSEWPEMRFETTHATRLSEALRLLETQAFDVALLDLSLPDARDLEAPRQVHRAAPTLPVVVLSGLHDEELALRAVQAGAQDYLVKGQGDAALLRRSLRYALERKRVEERLDFLATHDDVTGLPNRTLFVEQLRHAIARAARRRSRLAVMLAGLDDLRRINDSVGFALGDEVIKTAAQRIGACLDEDDLLARVGGDQFCIVLSDIGEIAEAARTVAKIREAIAAPVLLGDKEVFPSLSIGICMFPENGDHPETLFRNADLALERAREHGRNGYQFYSETLHAEAHARLALEAGLRGAVERKEMTVQYQPVLRLRDGAIAGIEALLRWRHPERGMLLPDSFVPLAEDSGLIVGLGEWALYVVCAQARRWSPVAVRIAINVSPVQLRRRDFIDNVARALRQSDLPPAQLELELTERSLQDQETADALRALKGLGVRIALDDFGTGYSSLANLRHLPIDTLKIDRSFVRGIGVDARDEVIVKAIIGMAHTLGIEVIAEGVESEPQLAFLRSQRCDHVQGNFVGVPLDAEAVFRRLSERRAMQGGAH